MDLVGAWSGKERYTLPSKVGGVWVVLPRASRVNHRFVFFLYRDIFVSSFRRFRDLISMVLPRRVAHS